MCYSLFYLQVQVMHPGGVSTAARAVTNAATFDDERACLVTARSTEIEPFTRRAVRFLAGIEGTAILDHMHVCIR